MLVLDSMVKGGEKSVGLAAEELQQLSSCQVNSEQ